MAFTSFMRALRGSSIRQSINPMIKNYLTIAFRNLRKSRGYSFINITGLAVGLTCCLLILLYVQHELSFDRYHENADRLYRLNVDLGAPGNAKYLAMVSPRMGLDLQANYPEVETSARFLHGSYLFRRADDPLVQHQEDNGLYADPSALNIFSFPWLRGDRTTALVEPFSVVMTEETARRYFGDEDPIGKVLIRDGRSYTVTGLMDAVPENSHFTFDLLVSLSTGQVLFPDFLTSWDSYSAHTYFLAVEGTDMAALESKFAAYIDEHLGASLQEHGEVVTLHGEPITNIYLDSYYHSSLSRSGDADTLYIFAGIALFILLIACINFMNLATARATERAREVGIRKVVGARRIQLAGQFLGESVLLAGLSMLLALFLVEITLPGFNTFAGKNLTFDILISPSIVVLFLGIACLVGIIAGSYPAFVLSAFRPVSVLSGAFRTSKRGTRLRKGLVVFQFALSIALMISTGIVYSQLDYMRNKDLGFQKEQQLILSYHGDTEVRQKLSTIQQTLLQHPDVLSVSASGDIPGTGNLHAGVTIENPDGVWQGAAWRYMAVDFDYIDTYSMELVAGRSFQKTVQQDSSRAVLLNETAVTHLGYTSPEDALGKGFEFSERHTGEIIGVVRDFHLKSLQQEVEPVYMLIDPDRFQYFSLRLQTQDLSRTMTELEQQWQTLVTQRPFEYHFLDESFGRLYRTEEQFGQVVALFTGLAVMVACLGLFGLASLIIRQRTKEIGLRKVLGAPSSGLLLLITRDFSLLVITAFMVAAPATYLAMTTWLNAFPYRTSFDYSMLFLAGAAALFVALATVSYQALRAIRANPVDTLRYE